MTQSNEPIDPQRAATLIEPHIDSARLPDGAMHHVLTTRGYQITLRKHPHIDRFKLSIMGPDAGLAEMAYATSWCNGIARVRRFDGVLLGKVKSEREAVQRAFIDVLMRLSLLESLRS